MHIQTTLRNVAHIFKCISLTWLHVHVQCTCICIHAWHAYMYNNIGLTVCIAHIQTTLRNGARPLSVSLLPGYTYMYTWHAYKYNNIGLTVCIAQVRMSSSVATRVFLTQLPSIEAREPYLPILLPPLCLNR